MDLVLLRVLMVISPALLASSDGGKSVGCENTPSAMVLLASCEAQYKPCGMRETCLFTVLIAALIRDRPSQLAV